MPLKSASLHSLTHSAVSQKDTSYVKSLILNVLAWLCKELGLASRLPFGTGADRTASTSSSPQKGSVPGDLNMLKLNGPASESQKNLVLVVCLLVMSVMCIGLIWQAQIISNQREDIKWLQSLKFGG